MLSHMKPSDLHLECTLLSTHSLLSSGAFSDFPKVTLPCLSHFFAHTPLSTAITLLSYINILPKTCVRLTTNSDENSSIDEYTQLPSLFAERFSQSKDLSSSTLAVCSVIILFSQESYFTLIVLEHDDCNPNMSILYPPQDYDISLMIFATMEQSIAINNRTHIVAEICCSIPLTHVQTLYHYPTILT